MVDSQVLATLFSSAYDGNLATVKSIVKEGLVPADTPDLKGSTALLWACYGGSLEVVEWLVRDAGAQVGHKNKDDRNALFFACEHCHKAVAAFLVGNGVDVNAKDGPSGHAPLHRACIAGQTRDQAGAEELIKWLLTSTGADPEATDLSGRKPGDADLSIEAPALKPSPRAEIIRRMLQEARGGTAPNGRSTTAGALTPAPVKPCPPRAVKSSTTRESVRAPLAVPVAAPAPSRVATRAAALAASNAAKPAVNAPPPAPVAVPAAGGGVSRVAARAAALAVSSGATTKLCASNPASAALATPAASIPANGVTSPITVGDPSKPVVASTARRTAGPSYDSRPSWAKPRAGGVFPRTGGSLPVAANAAPVGSPAAVTAAATAAVNSSSGKTLSLVRSSPIKTCTNQASPASPTPAVEPFTRLIRRPSTNVATLAGNPEPVPAVTPSTPFARYQRTASGSVSGPGAPRAAASPPAKGAAHAVIAASNAPKASALAAAFENKARGRQSPPPRRGDSGLSALALAKRAPLLSNSSSASTTGSTRNGGPYNGSSSSTKVIPGPAPAPAAALPFSNPSELLGTGSVMKKKQVYVAAAQKASNSNKTSSPKNVPTPFLGKLKKKESSFMDKVVQIFSISPQSSRESSPTRSSSRSPNRSASRSPHLTQHGGEEMPRLGFFHSNLSFKEKE